MKTLIQPTRRLASLTLLNFTRVILAGCIWVSNSGSPKQNIAKPIIEFSGMHLLEAANEQVFDCDRTTWSAVVSKLHEIKANVYNDFQCSKCLVHNQNRKQIAFVCVRALYMYYIVLRITKSGTALRFGRIGIAAKLWNDVRRFAQQYARSDCIVQSVAPTYMRPNREELQLRVSIVLHGASCRSLLLCCLLANRHPINTSICSLDIATQGEHTQSTSKLCVCYICLAWACSSS